MGGIKSPPSLGEGATTEPAANNRIAGIQNSDGAPTGKGEESASNGGSADDAGPSQNTIRTAAATVTNVNARKSSGNNVTGNNANGANNTAGIGTSADKSVNQNNSRCANKSAEITGATVLAAGSMADVVAASMTYRNGTSAGTDNAGNHQNSRNEGRLLSTGGRTGNTTTGTSADRACDSHTVPRVPSSRGMRSSRGSDADRRRGADRCPFNSGASSESTNGRQSGDLDIWDSTTRSTGAIGRQSYTGMRRLSNASANTGAQDKDDTTTGTAKINQAQRGGLAGNIKRVPSTSSTGIISRVPIEGGAGNSRKSRGYGGRHVSSQSNQCSASTSSSSTAGPQSFTAGGRRSAAVEVETAAGVARGSTEANGDSVDATKLKSDESVSLFNAVSAEGWLSKKFVDQLVAPQVKSGPTTSNESSKEGYLLVYSCLTSSPVDLPKPNRKAIRPTGDILNRNASNTDQNVITGADANSNSTGTDTSTGTDLLAYWPYVSTDAEIVPWMSPSTGRIRAPNLRDFAERYKVNTGMIDGMALGCGTGNAEHYGDGRVARHVLPSSRSVFRAEVHVEHLLRRSSTLTRASRGTALGAASDVADMCSGFDSGYSNCYSNPMLDSAVHSVTATAPSPCASLAMYIDPAPYTYDQHYIQPTTYTGTYTGTYAGTDTGAFEMANYPAMGGDIIPTYFECAPNTGAEFIPMSPFRMVDFNTGTLIPVQMSAPVMLGHAHAGESIPYYSGPVGGGAVYHHEHAHGQESMACTTAVVGGMLQEVVHDSTGSHDLVQNDMHVAQHPPPPQHTVTYSPPHLPTTALPPAPAYNNEHVKPHWAVDEQNNTAANNDVPAVSTGLHTLQVNDTNTTKAGSYANRPNKLATGNHGTGPGTYNSQSIPQSPNINPLSGTGSMHGGTGRGLYTGSQHMRQQSRDGGQSRSRYSSGHRFGRGGQPGNMPSPHMNSSNQYNQRNINMQRQPNVNPGTNANSGVPVNQQMLSQSPQQYSSNGGVNNTTGTAAGNWPVLYSQPPAPGMRTPDESHRRQPSGSATRLLGKPGIMLNCSAPPTDSAQDTEQSYMYQHRHTAGNNGAGSPTTRTGVQHGGQVNSTLYNAGAHSPFPPQPLDRLTATDAMGTAQSRTANSSNARGDELLPEARWNNKMGTGSDAASGIDSVANNDESPSSDVPNDDNFSKAPHAMHQSLNTGYTPVQTGRVDNYFSQQPRPFVNSMRRLPPGPSGSQYVSRGSTPSNMSGGAHSPSMATTGPIAPHSSNASGGHYGGRGRMHGHSFSSNTAAASGGHRLSPESMTSSADADAPPFANRSKLYNGGANYQFMGRGNQRRPHEHRKSHHNTYNNTTGTTSGGVHHSNAATPATGGRYNNNIRGRSTGGHRDGGNWRSRGGCTATGTAGNPLRTGGDTPVRDHKPSASPKN